jgi:hypothetical protein
MRGWPDVLAVHGSVWAEGRGAPPHLDVGDRVVVTGLLERPAGTFGAFLRHRGYPVELSVSAIRFQGPPAGPLATAATLRVASTATSTLVPGSARRVY